MSFHLIDTWEFNEFPATSEFSFQTLTLNSGASNPSDQVGSFGTSTVLNMQPQEIKNLRYRRDKEEPESSYYNLMFPKISNLAKSTITNA